MIYAVLALPAVLAANTAEVSTSDVRKGAAFENILRADYDYNDNKDFLKEVSLAGDLLEKSGDNDLSVSYDVNHNFKSKNTEVKLSANTMGTTFSVDYDTDSNVKEVS